MTTRLYLRTLPLTLVLLVACKADDPADTEADTGTAGQTSSDSDEPTTGTPLDCAGITVPPVDEAACKPLADDYQPRVNDSADDMWPACIADTLPYTQVDAKTPGSAARIDAYEAMAKLLWDAAAAPSPADFTAARDQYLIPEGLASRLVRREDLHYPPVPMAEWDPQVDGDKQCTVPALAAKYTDRCVGPDHIQPIVDAAFAAGQKGEGDARVHAATIHAALDWFLYLSVYKEAQTCTTENPADCDSAWAYYTGLEPMTSGKAFAREVLDASQTTHERIWDGIRAVRCWRDLNRDDMDGYPFIDTLDADSKKLFERGWEQLDQALHRGLAVVVRQRTQAYFQSACGEGDEYTPAAWAYLQIAGPALQREADERDATQAKVLAALWTSAAPTAQELADGVAALDAIFPCP